ncbi:hypothetical protein TSUD_256710 [Trifolium subterraneum]|uniref:Uncharacterized protein n=1 Tax=Trifolium subterraneum TaxID=3900 RepID=A0A2Z6MEA6_TRISU|nr:hypothetical protein TSUD_256710 [Trifolium subterraneum]
MLKAHHHHQGMTTDKINVCNCFEPVRVFILGLTILTRGATVDASHFGHGHPITSLATHVVEERQENDNVHMSEPEEVIVMDSVVDPPSDVQSLVSKPQLFLIPSSTQANILATSGPLSHHHSLSLFSITFLSRL